MELNRIRVGKAGRRHKPFRRFDAVLATANEVNYSLRVEPPCVINCLQEDLIQCVNLSTVSGIFAWRLIDRLKCDKTRFAGQFRADLVPKSVEFLLNHGDIGAGCTDIRPDP